MKLTIITLALLSVFLAARLQDLEARVTQLERNSGSQPELMHTLQDRVFKNTLTK